MFFNEIRFYQHCEKGMDKNIERRKAYKKLAIECDSDDVPLDAFQYGFYFLRKSFYFF